MSKTEKTPIDNLIPPAVQTVALLVERGNKPYFWKDDVLREILTRRQLQGVLEDLRKRYQAWQFERIVLRDLQRKVGDYLQTTRDHYGIRQYECYNAGEPRRRWMPIRAVTVAQLRMILQEARVLERDVHLRGEGYHLLYERLEKLNREYAVVGDIYDDVAPMIAEFKKVGKVEREEARRAAS